MFQSLVITLREGVEAALIVGIVSGYLKKTGRSSWIRVVYWGLAAAIAASLVLGYILHRLQLTELGDAYEGWLMLAGAAFVASMVVWMWRTGRRLKQEIETRLSGLSSGQGQSAGPEGVAGWGLFLFVFLMVFREGTETVLFLAAVSLRTSELANFIGGVIGLGLAIGLGIAFFKGSLKVNLKKFFAVTTLVLLVVALQLLVSGVHELSEAGVLPSGPREMRLVGPFVYNDAFFFVVVVALCLFLVIAQRIQAGATTPEALAGLAAPERRRVLAEQRRDRFWKMAVAAVGLLVIVVMSADMIYSRAAQAVEPPERLAMVNGEARVPVAQLADYKLHHYLVGTPAGGVGIIALLDRSDTVHAGLDACMICGTQGYRQDGANVICRNCGAAINAGTIGVPGGCNPIHIDYRVENGVVVFSGNALVAGAKVFGH
jgi:high-affinity iron transporter